MGYTSRENYSQEGRIACFQMAERYSLEGGTTAVVASVGVAAIFTTVGYSDGASIADFWREISIAFCSYVSAALLVQSFLDDDDWMKGLEGP